MEQVITILEMIAFAIDLVGIAILVYAALKFIAHFLGFEIKQLRGLESVEGIRDLRLRLGSYILLSLEFIIISDIIMTGISRNVDDLLALGLLVIIRVALSFFLGRELNEVKAQE
jgi:uncharacterized membrane protein